MPGPPHGSLSRSDSSEPEGGVAKISATPLISDAPLAGSTLKEGDQSARQEPSSTSYVNVELSQMPLLTSAQSGDQGKKVASKRERQGKSRLSSGNSVPIHPSPQREDRLVSRDDQIHTSRASPITTVYTLAHLVFFSILGTLARLGVETITLYENMPVTSSVLWANLGGSLVLGFLIEDQRIFREEWGIFTSASDWSFHPTSIESSDDETSQRAYESHSRVKISIPLFIGLASGFCGSTTSFSSFIRDAFLVLGNDLSPHPPDHASVVARNGGYSFEALLAVLILHPAVSISALKVGTHLAAALDPLTPTLPFKNVRKIVDPCVIFLGLGSWFAAIFLSSMLPHQQWHGNVTLALVFAPIGCLFRFYVSRYLNPRIASFPLGTFVVNITGTIVLGVCFDLQHSARAAEHASSCRVLEGLMSGFCGSATTVSTWVAELTGLKRRQSYIYGLTSVFVALSCLIAIIGGLQWSIGLQTPVCT